MTRGFLLATVAGAVTLGVGQLLHAAALTLVLSWSGALVEGLARISHTSRLATS